LERLASKLNPTGGIRKAGKALSWYFQKDEVLLQLKQKIMAPLEFGKKLSSMLTRVPYILEVPAKATNVPMPVVGSIFSTRSNCDVGEEVGNCRRCKFNENKVHVFLT